MCTFSVCVDGDVDDDDDNEMCRAKLFFFALIFDHLIVGRVNVSRNACDVRRRIDRVARASTHNQPHSRIHVIHVITERKRVYSEYLDPTVVESRLSIASRIAQLV